jgi:hypothetical protein
MKRLVICKITISLILSLLVSATTSLALDKSSLVGAWLLDGKEVQNDALCISQKHIAREK